MGKGTERGSLEKGRLYSGTAFNFLHTLLASFAMLLLPMYFTDLNVSIVTYAFLLTIGNVFSFILKPIIGYFSDVHGERKLLMTSLLIFVVSLYSIGLTADVLQITLLKIVSDISQALVMIVIMIYAYRVVEKKPDKKVGIFGGLGNAGWIPGLLLPGIIMDYFGVPWTFNLVLGLGLLWVFITHFYTKKYKIKEKLKIKPSFSFIKKIPLPMAIKIIDISIFNAFLFYFIEFALKSLKLSRGTVSIVVVVEVAAFSLLQFFISRFSNKTRRKFWVPVGMIIHIIGIVAIVFASELLHYFIASFMFGLAGAFIDIWIYSRINETVKKYDKGKVFGTFGWSFDIATIVGAQLPLMFILLNLNVFASLFILPIIGLIVYIFSKKKV